jgi:hypothetical protein
MSINGKRDAFTLEDFRACAKTAGLKRGRAEALLDEVLAAVKQWPQFAEATGIPQHQISAIAATHRLEWH